MNFDNSMCVEIAAKKREIELFCTCSSSTVAQKYKILPFIDNFGVYMTVESTIANL